MSFLRCGELERAGRRRRAGLGGEVGIAADALGFVVELSAGVVGAGGRCVGAGREFFQLEQVSDLDGTVPPLGLGFDEGQFGLRQDPLGFEQVEEGHLAAGVELLSDLQGLAGLGEDVFLVPVDQPLGLAIDVDDLGRLRGHIDLDLAERGSRRGNVGPG